MTASHHHADHSGGVRPFAALGATIVVHQAAVGCSSKCSPAGTRSCCPIASTTRTPTRRSRGVPDGGSVTLADPARPVVVLPEKTTHATTTILVWVPSEGVLFVNGDTYTPGAPPGPGARSLEATIEANGLRPQFLAGGHGGIITYPAFRQALGLPPA